MKKRRGEFARYDPTPNLFERAFLLGIQDIRGRSEIRVPRVFLDREWLFPGEEAAFFLEPQNHRARNAGFGREDRERQRPAHGREDLFDSFLRVIRKRICLPGIPGQNLLRASATLPKHLTSAEVAAAHEPFGARFSARPAANLS